jgi:hypothetical protein
MARTSHWGYSNVTPAAHRQIPLVDLGIITNYGLRKDEPDICLYKNNTAATDALELVKYTYRNIDKVNVDKELKVLHPAPVNDGLLYGVETQAIFVTEDDATDFRVDEPIVVQVQIRHNNSGNITAAAVQQALARTVSLLQDENGNWQIDALMRGSMRPKND